MTGEEFRRWLDEVRVRNLVRNQAHLAALWDVDPRTVTVWKKRGASVIVGYACAALLAGLRHDAGLHQG